MLPASFVMSIIELGFHVPWINRDKLLRRSLQSKEKNCVRHQTNIRPFHRNKNDSLGTSTLSYCNGAIQPE